MTERIKRNEQDIRALYAELTNAKASGESVTNFLSRKQIPAGTFYAWCHRLGLSVNFTGRSMPTRKITTNPRAEFVEFSPNGVGEKIEITTKDGVTIKCQSVPMMKNILNTLAGA